MEKKIIKLGIPKGSLLKSTLKVFKEAGFNIELPERSYVLRIDDPEIECFLLRSQEIPRYIEEGKLDLGISGDDWIAENKAQVQEVCDLKYAKHEIKKIQWVLAVPHDSPIKSIQDLEGKVVATEIINTVKDYFAKKGVNPKIEFSWGATEVKPPLFADAVVDLSETGASLAVHNLRVLDTVLESSTKLIANPKSYQEPAKREKIDNLAMLLQGAVKSEQMVALAMHVSGANLDKVAKILPSLQEPTITKIPNVDWYDVMAIVGKRDGRELLLKLKKLGCEGIVEFPLKKVV